MMKTRNILSALMLVVVLLSMVSLPVMAKDDDLPGIPWFCRGWFGKLEQNRNSEICNRVYFIESENFFTGYPTEVLPSYHSCWSTEYKITVNYETGEFTAYPKYKGYPFDMLPSDTLEWKNSLNEGIYSCPLVYGYQKDLWTLFSDLFAGTHEPEKFPTTLEKPDSYYWFDGETLHHYVP